MSEPEQEGIDLLNSVDNLSDLRAKLLEIARMKGEWAGIPMPLGGQSLVLEPTYPYAGLAGMMGPPDDPEEPDEAAGMRVRNVFWSSHRRCWISVLEKQDGSITWGLRAAVHHLSHDLETMRSSDAWGIEQEHNALQLLATLLPHRQFKQYLLAGMFMEKSKRSGVHYLFRRLRPTVAITVNPHPRFGERSRILAALCLHPIGYYSGSWAGAMCPTDDVIAHLMLMRGDEHMFWRRAQQHPPFTPEAGL